MFVEPMLLFSILLTVSFAVSFWLWVRTWIPFVNSNLKGFPKFAFSLGWRSDLYGGIWMAHFVVVSAMVEMYIAGVLFMLLSGLFFYAVFTKHREAYREERVET